MKYISTYMKFNESNILWDTIKDMDIPGVPKNFPTLFDDKHKLIVNIFDKLSIDVHVNFNEYDDVYYTIPVDEGFIKLSLFVNTNDFIIEQDDIESDNEYEEINTPIELIDYLFEIGVINISTWMKKINESIQDPVWDLPNNDTDCVRYVMDVLNRYGIPYSMNGTKSINIKDGQYSLNIEEFIDEDTSEIETVIFIYEKGNDRPLYHCVNKYIFKDNILKLFNIDMSKVMKKINR